MTFEYDAIIERLRNELIPDFTGTASLGTIAGRSFVGESDVMGYVDLTILKPETTERDVEVLCERAKALRTKAVCVASRLVDTAARSLRGADVLPICVVGFPHANAPADIVGEEARWAVSHGAREIDMVLPLGLLKAGSHADVVRFLEHVVTASGGPVKVILETCMLTPEEIVAASVLAVKAGAVAVKTSTGFSTGGATLAAVRLMRRTVGDAIGVKASGGIRTRAQAVEMLAAGADRIGASALA